MWDITMIPNGSVHVLSIEHYYLVDVLNLYSLELELSYCRTI